IQTNLGRLDMSGKTVWVVGGLVLAVGAVAFLSYHETPSGKDAAGTIVEAKRAISDDSSGGATSTTGSTDQGSTGRSGRQSADQPGDRGDKGDKGDKSDRGDKGDKGDKGAKGDKGDKSDRG